MTAPSAGATGTRGMAAGLWRAVCRVHPRRSAATVIAGWAEHDVLTYASAIAFQVFFALIPLTLFALGLLGLFDLGAAWRTDLAPDVRRAVSPEVFRIVDDTVRRVVGGRHLFWATAGAALAVWEVSGAVRAVMGSFNRIYGVREGRPWLRRYSISIALATAATPLCIAAFAVVRFGPDLVGDGALGIAATVGCVAVALG